MPDQAVAKMRLKAEARVEHKIKLDAISFLKQHNLPLDAADDLAKLLKLMITIGEQRASRRVLYA